MYNKTLKDVINRYKVLQGYRVHYVPGFDCFGTNVEDAFAHLVGVEEKVQGLDLSLHGHTSEETMLKNLNQEDRNKLTVRNVIQEQVKDSMAVQMAELQQWGIMTDWRYSYFTMMPSYQAMVLRKFKEFIEKRMVVWGDRPVLWSTEK